jgi:hypothetical protein
MLHALRRHPLPMRTRFGHSLVLTYAFPPGLLAPMLPPGLTLDSYRGPDGVEHGFVAVGLVSTRELRPAPLPASCGSSPILTGYRIFTRFRTPAGRAMRGLWILRSDTDRRWLVLGGNLLTRYHYHLARIRLDAAAGRLTASVRSRDGRADLAVVADLGRPAPLPAGSPFGTAADARRFAGPLPYTFDYEAATRSMIVVKAVRSRWQPEPVSVTVDRLTFFRHGGFAGSTPRLANAFHVADLDYGWHRGSRRTLDGAPR